MSRLFRFPDGSCIVAAVFFIVCFWATCNKGAYKDHQVLTSDRGGYYLYLPAVFIEKDLAQLRFLERIDSVYRPNGNERLYGIYDNRETGRRLTKYTAGVALLEMPFFLVTHAIVRVAGRWPPDGYSPPYQFAMALAAFFYSSAGLLLLGLFLRTYFPQKAVVLCLLSIAFGTNLYYYSAFEPGMSHNYSFFLFSALLYLFGRWLAMPRNGLLPLIALVGGLIVITRVPDALVFLFLLLWPGVGARLKRKATKNGRSLYLNAALALLTFCAVVFVQLAYWKYTTGSFLHQSYEEEHFNFGHPEIWKGLWSYRKGWFVYTPLALIAFAGIAVLRRQQKDFVLPVLTYFVVTIYVVFSWWMWFYGGSFGCRAMIESLTILSLPLCALIRAALSAARWVRCGAGLLLVLLLSLNIFQTYQYSLGTIHWCDMSGAYYWRVFGKLKATPEDRQYLTPWDGRN